ncbi:DUF4116 domain-containing protein [Bilifractor sp. LCP19S3_H10]|uniref:DUF4116 domain-containing protein n=1 Tax=Bilifractor sp. LCP19S3_H10 TaxID=3438736 RepID=UPI003F8F2984
MKNQRVQYLIKKLELKQIDFMHLSVADRETKKIALAAVKLDPLNVYHVSKFWDDYDVMKAAVQGDGMTLQYASKRLRFNKEIAEIAVRQNGSAYSFLSKGLRKSTKLLRLALETDPDAILLGFSFQKHDPGLVMMAVKGNPEVLYKLAGDDYDSISVSEDFSIYPNTPWELDSFGYVRCKNREIVLEAVKNCGAMIKYASDTLRRDPEIVKAALAEDPDAEFYVEEEVLKKLGLDEEE